MYSYLLTVNSFFSFSFFICLTKIYQIFRDRVNDLDRVYQISSEYKQETMSFGRILNQNTFDWLSTLHLTPALVSSLFFQE